MQNEGEYPQTGVIPSNQSKLETEMVLTTTTTATHRGDQCAERLLGNSIAGGDELAVVVLVEFHVECVYTMLSWILAHLNQQFEAVFCCKHDTNFVDKNNAWFVNL